MKAISARAFIAAALGVWLAACALRPECTGATESPTLPELRALTRLPAMVT